MNENKKFWTHGNGSDFVKWAKTNIDNQEYNFNKEMFNQYDTEVDKSVEDWLDKGVFKDIMHHFHDPKPDNNLDVAFKNLKEDLASTPSWVNFDLIEEGTKLSQRSGLIGLMVLRNFALLGGYYFTNLVKPLIATGALQKGVVYRLYNTLKFWIEVSRSTENAQELRLNTCLKTRIIHAASRLMIEKKETNWDYKKYGVPINYADMIATNIAFTVYFLFGLSKLNFKYSQKEEEGIFHLWKYVTWLLGVPEHLIPNNKEEAISFFYSWTQHQELAGEGSTELATSLVENNTPISLFKLGIIKRNIGHVHKSISNYLIDENILHSLHIPSEKYKSLIVSLVKFKNNFQKSTQQQLIQGNKEQLSVLNDYKT